MKAEHVGEPHEFGSWEGSTVVESTRRRHCEVRVIKQACLVTRALDVAEGGRRNYKSRWEKSSEKLLRQLT